MLARVNVRGGFPAIRYQPHIMKAIVLQGEPGKASLVTDRPYPSPRPGYVLVDVKAVALNPTDWKHIDFDFLNDKGAQSGCDFAGVVAETGSGYSKPWEKGDRICGFVHGGNNLQHEDGAFAERIAVKADVAFRIPDNMSFEDAATLGVGVITCGQGLFQEMGLNLPSQPTTKGEMILIYGGSSATGTLGIQFAKLYASFCSSQTDNLRADLCTQCRLYPNHHLFSTQLRPGKVTGSHCRIRLQRSGLCRTDQEFHGQ